jgi:Uncharacterised nucleotidyltransferase
LLLRLTEMMPPMTHRDGAERRLIQLLVGTADRRQAAADEVRALAGEADETTLVALLKRLNMLVLIGDRLRGLGLRDMPTLERELASLRSHAYGWGVITEFIALDVLDALRAAGIRAMPLKGSSLARQLYHDVAARTSRDIDILVAPEDLAGAVGAVQELGWRWQADVSRIGGLPLLHETLVHPSLPRIELHWRVHWYEGRYGGRFAADALARATPPAAEAPLEMQPLDGLIALMLFYARDGFTGLRFAADAAAWWDLKCAGSAGPAPGEVVAEFYPGLVAPVSVSSKLLGQLVGIPSTPSSAVPFRWRVAAGLASPFLEDGRQQAEANAALIDLLLAPPSAAGDALRRVISNAPVDGSQPAAPASPPWRASLSHVVRVACRWALAFVPAIMRGYDLGRRSRSFRGGRALSG